jgi:hypothetical protein
MYKNVCSSEPEVSKYHGQDVDCGLKRGDKMERLLGGEGGCVFVLVYMQPIVTGSSPHLGICRVVRGPYSCSKIWVYGISFTNRPSIDKDLSGSKAL